MTAILLIITFLLYIIAGSLLMKFSLFAEDKFTEMSDCFRFLIMTFLWPFTLMLMMIYYVFIEEH